MDACYVISGWTFTRLGDESSHDYRVTNPHGMLESYSTYFSSVDDMKMYVNQRR